MNNTSSTLSFLSKFNQWKESKLVGFFENLFKQWEKFHPTSYQWFKQNWLQPRLKNAANFLSFFRGGAVPLLIILIILHWKWSAFLLCLVASLTDLIDGAIAKAGRCVTEKGSIIDPFMDKLLFIGIIIATKFSYQQPLWLPLMMLAIMGEIINGSTRVYKVKHKIRPYDATSTGKAKFFFQMGVIYLVLLPDTLVNLVTLNLTFSVYKSFTNLLLAISTFLLYFGIFQEIRKISLWKKTTPYCS